MKIRNLLIAVPTVLALSACSDDSDHDFQPGIDAQAVEVQTEATSAPLFDPTGSPPLLPFPSTLLLLGSTDSTANIPLGDDGDPDNTADPRVALNQLDGFSTISPISTPMARPLDPASIEVGRSVFVFEVIALAGAGFAPTTALNTLGPDAIAAVASGSNLVLQPLAPLNPRSTYLVMLTDELTDLQGVPLQRSRTYGLAAGDVDLIDANQSLLQTLIRTHLAFGDSNGVERDSVVFSWTFNTQTIRRPLQAVKDASTAQSLLATTTGATTSTFTGLGRADVWTGTLDVPYYQTAGSAENPRDALDNFWLAEDGGFITGRNPLPAATSTQTIPVLMTIPNEDSTFGSVMPEAGWPVVIFQHGITRNRLDVIGVADALADVGFATVAIDMPMHGIVDSPVAAAQTNFPTDQERHFNIDVIGNEEDSPREPDGRVDLSGSHFYQLDNLPNSRDNLRQAVSDLFTLSNSLGGVQGAMTDTPPIAFDISRKAFVGHSLGAIAGSVFLSYDDTIQSATLAMPGSGISQLLANSQSFGPDLIEGLASVGIEPGSADFDLFFLTAQTLVDSGDPANHMSFLANLGTPVHMIEVIGDQTIPNFVATAPFSGTEPMAALLGLEPTTTTVSGSALVRFSAGDHGSILNPGASAAATIEMQTQMAVFATSGGTQLPITDSSVIADGLPEQ